MSTIDKSTKTENKLEVVGNWKDDESGNDLFSGYGVSLQVDENVLELGIGDGWTIL
jgi:hypothetical protein